MFNLGHQEEGGIVKNDESRGRLIRMVTNREMQEAETYRFWRGQTTAERVEAIDDIVRDAYAAKGVDVDVQKSDRSITRIQRT